MGDQISELCGRPAEISGYGYTAARIKPPSPGRQTGASWACASALKIAL